MKIMVIIPTLYGGGTERAVSRLTKEWAKSHQVILVSFDAGKRTYDYGGQIVNIRLPASDYPLKKVYNFGARAMRLARLLRQEDPDRIVSFMDIANVPAVVAATMATRLGRLYVSVRSDPAGLPFVLRVCIPWLYRLPTAVVAVSEGVKRKLISMGLPGTKISVIPNPIADTDGRAIGQESTLLLTTPFILGVGRLVREKGFDQLLQAFRKLARRELHLIVLGKGKDRRALIALTHELGIADRVHFPGWVVNVETWYRHAVCFVLSSRSEGRPNAIVEAMANGCPVISFDCDYGPSEIIEHGENGLLVTNGDIEGMTKAIARVLDCETLRRKLANKGMQGVKMYDVKTIATHWLA